MVVQGAVKATENRTDAHSYDVFDTLIVRSVLVPSDLFELFAVRHNQRHGTALDAAHFHKARMAAELGARRTTQLDEVTLDEIYARLAQDEPRYAGHVDTLKALEIEVEHQNCHLIADNVRQATQQMASGQTVARCSDFYIGAPFIASLLANRDPAFQPGAVVVSADHGKTKHSGRLFEVLSQHLNVTPGSIRHTDDNAHSDIKMAHAATINAHHYDRSHHNHFERLLLPERARDPYASVIGGVSRVTRLEHPLRGDDKDVVWECTANVCAPLLFGFCLWIVINAQKRGLKALYFVSRDGEILVPVARDIAAWLGTDIACHYLYGSRKAIGSVSLKPGTVQVDKDLLLAYLDQEGFTRDSDVGFVDLGYKAGQQIALEQLLADRGIATRIHGFYFALEQNQSDMRLAYQHLTSATVPDMLESFCSATHSSVIGYQRQADGRIGPVMAEDDTEVRFWQNWGLDLQQAATAHYARVFTQSRIAQDFDLDRLVESFRVQSMRLYNHFITRPTTAETEVYGRIIHADGARRDGWDELAPRQSLGRLIRMVCWRDDPSRPTIWVWGAICRSLGTTAVARGLGRLYSLRLSLLALLRR